MKHCGQCGSRNEKVIPEGEDRHRDVCPDCGNIYYDNPKSVVGCLIHQNDKILLCRRAIEPSYGRWTVPAGYQELAESAAEGARRETREEAHADVEILGPHAYLDLPHIGQQYQLFHARLVEQSFRAGEESLEVRWFDLTAIPWSQLAFPVVHYALQLFVEDRRQGRTQIHIASLAWSGEGSRFDPVNYRLQDHICQPFERHL
jgi:ADP-ribose/FAD diphosphatase